MKYLSDHTAIVRVQKDGRITIPKRFLKILGWEPGDKFEILLDEAYGSVIIRRCPKV